MLHLQHSQSASVLALQLQMKDAQPLHLLCDCHVVGLIHLHQSRQNLLFKVCLKDMQPDMMLCKG